MFKKLIVILILGFVASASFADRKKFVNGEEAYEILNEGKIIYSTKHLSWNGFDHHVLKDGYLWLCTIYQNSQKVGHEVQPLPSYSFYCDAYEAQ